MLQNVKDKVIHLTIDPAGLVSLWDSKESALRGKESFDGYIALVLTTSQVQELNWIHEFAKNEAAK